MQTDHDVVTTWLPDPSHYPEQMTPLSATVWFEAMGAGLHSAARELRAPFGGFATCTQLGWAYELELPAEWDPDPERLRDAALTLPERWQSVLLPRVHAITHEIEAMRPEPPAPEQATSLFDRLWELVQEQWQLHFLTVLPAQFAAQVLHDEYSARYPDQDELAPYRLLEGIENPADVAIRELASLARALGVEDIIREYLPEPALQLLAGSARGRRWLHALDEYLLLFGGRVRWHELSLPREVEQPTLTLESIRLLLDGSGPTVSARTIDAPADLRDLVQRVRAAYALKELHTYEIDYPGLLATREALLGFGRRLYAEGLLEEVADVWMLERSELRDVVAGEDLPTREIVANRRAELSRGKEQGPAPFLGDPPPASERHAILENFYGRARAGLAGTGASRGEAEGTARVVTGERDFARVERGDVLVTTTTTPAWTPLFPSLAALVTETGGILSHAAVVAREYGLPAVVGVADATRTIPDGARIRVDGGAGTVVLL